MSKRTKIWLIIAASLVIIGVLICAAVIAVYNWDFSILDTEVYETYSYDIDESFESISINIDTADIKFFASEDGDCKVVWHESQNIKRYVEVTDGTLVIRSVDEREWYERLSLSFDSPQITICLPLDEYNSLDIKESTGDISICEEYVFESVNISISTGEILVKHVSADTFDLSASTGAVTVSDITCEHDLKINVSTGKTSLSDVECKNVISSGSTGDVLFKNVIASEKITVERSTGDVELKSSDAAEIFIKTSTGDVTGTLLSEKTFVADTNTGDIDVPESSSGGRCEITTDTGDIIIETE